jgi:hypothetical protein
MFTALVETMCVLQSHITFATRLMEVVIDDTVIITLFNGALVSTDVACRRAKIMTNL